MRILYISFGYYPYWSGGMVKNQIGLMRNLATIGHQLTYFVAGRFDFRGKPYLKPRKIEGLETIELVNSPNPYDPYCYRTNPIQHCSNTTIEDLTREIVDFVDPHVVHISDMRMHCASIIGLLKSRRIPVVKTFHNYWDLCPKGDLLFEDRELCLDLKRGEKCLHCLANYGPAEIPWLHKVKGSVPYDKIFPIINRFGFVKNSISPSETTPRVSSVEYTAGAYQNRRNYFVDMLNKCDAIHVTSRNVGRLISRYGINRRNINVIPLSAEGLSDIEPKADLAPNFPVIFGYRGRLHTRKGIDVLLNAFKELDQNKSRLLIYGDGDVRRLEPFLRGGLSIEYRGKYAPERINEILKEIDIGIIPSVWEEIFGIVGLEYINARIPVIASNIGGISEWLKEGENGYLFPPGDSKILSQIMQTFLDNPKKILDLQKRMKPWKNMRTYANEISKLYERIIHES